MPKDLRHRGGAPDSGKSRPAAAADDEDNSKALRRPEHSAWGLWDWPYFIAVTVLAIATRFYRITEPAGVVFDEVRQSESD